MILSARTQSAGFHSGHSGQTPLLLNHIEPHCKDKVGSVPKGRVVFKDDLREGVFQVSDSSPDTRGNRKSWYRDQDVRLPDLPGTSNNCVRRFTRDCCNLAHFALVCLRITMSELASFHSARKARVVGSSLDRAVKFECRSHDHFSSGAPSPGVTAVTRQRDCCP